VIAACARLAAGFQLAGHRGELVLIHSAKALAAIEGADVVSTEHLAGVAKMALVHRRVRGESGSIPEWKEAEDAQVTDLILDVAGV
jgi:magnesium chelatase subunit I